MYNEWIEPEIEETVDAKYAKGHLEALLVALYETGDTNALEWHLEEVCHSLGVTVPKERPVLEKKNCNRMMHWYLGYQRALEDQFAGRRMSKYEDEKWGN